MPPPEKKAVQMDPKQENQPPRQVCFDDKAERTVHRRLLACQSVPETNVSLSSRLAAAKPVVWRGIGDLPQYTWAGPPLKGTWLVLDLWSGFSGLCLALLSMGTHFYALAAESDSEARACASQAMPNIVHVDAVEKIHVRDLKGLLQRRTLRGIILGGGSPCQPNSSLNRFRGGLSDPRSHQPKELDRLVRECRSEPLCQDLEVVAFLENVGSMPHDVLDQYNRWMQSEPVRINAASCGWVQRNRLYWLCSKRRGLEPNLAPPIQWDWLFPAEQPPTLKYVGSKPVPPRVHWDDGFQPLLDPTHVLKSQGQGAMHTFTREFRHPDDRVSQASPAAARKFEEDGRRFPPGAYEDHNLVWKKEKWRQPNSSERAQILGAPISAVAACAGHPDRQQQKRNSLLGNGFHIPCLKPR